VRGVRILVYCAYPRNFREYIFFFGVGLLVNLVLRNAMLCSSCARAKAACKPFDADGV